MKNEVITSEQMDFIRKQFKQCSPALLALGDAVRQDILMILSECLDEGMNVMDITARTNLSRPAVSHHLKILKTAGFVGSIKIGTQVYYFITLKESFSRLKELVAMLDKLAKVKNKGGQDKSRQKKALLF